MRMLDLSDLWEMGIKFTPQHLNRLVRAGRFPAPVKLGANQARGCRRSGRNAWPTPEIEKYLADRIKERDASIVALAAR